MNSLIYAGVLLSIIAGFVGAIVAWTVLRRAIAGYSTPRPVLIWLVVALFLIAIAQAVEQIRVLIFRLSFDGYLSRDFFVILYNDPWTVLISKILAAIGIFIASVVKMALYFDKPDREVGRMTLLAIILTLAAWVGLAGFIELVDLVNGS